jgi:hypothetical protein
MERIARALQGAEPIAALARRLPGSDLQSLLLHVTRERSAVRAPAELLTQYERVAMAQPANVDARALADIECAAFACAIGFEPLELAPVAPLGLNTVLGGIDQNSCLATVRGLEVLADPTTAAALECARRRRTGITGPIALCSRSRVLRLQPIKGPGLFPHFAVFSLVTSARDTGSMRVELSALRQHLGVYLALLEQQPSLEDAGIEVSISDTERNAQRLELAHSELLEPLQRERPRVSFQIDHNREQGRNYYSGLCLRLDLVFADGERWNLADGGFTDWTQRLLSNAKERLFVSGIGVERLVYLAGRAAQSDD